MFVTAERPGTAEALQDGPDKAKMRATPVENLFLMTGGRTPSNPAEFIRSERFDELLAVAQENFDRVIIDTPPVLAANDAVVLSTKVSGTLLVVRASETTESELTHATETLQEVGANLLGTMLNGFNQTMSYGYSYRYRSYDQYGRYGDYHEEEPAREASGESAPDDSLRPLAG